MLHLEEDKQRRFVEGLDYRFFVLWGSIQGAGALVLVFCNQNLLLQLLLLSHFALSLACGTLGVLKVFGLRKLLKIIFLNAALMQLFFWPSSCSMQIALVIMAALQTGVIFTLLLSGVLCLGGFVLQHLVLLASPTFSDKGYHLAAPVVVTTMAMLQAVHFMYHSNLCNARLMALSQSKVCVKNSFVLIG
jgi:hypothetical protein